MSRAINDEGPVVKGEGNVVLGSDGQRLGHEPVHLSLLAEASQGLDDIEAGRVSSVVELRVKYGR